MILERKVPINSYGSRTSIEGFIMFRLATKLPMNVETARDAIINHIEGEVRTAHNNGSFSASKFELYMSELEYMKTLPIIYSKETTYPYTEGNVHYVQMLLSLDKVENTTERAHPFLSDIVSALLGAVYGGYGGYVNARCPLQDFTYEVANVKFGHRGYSVRVGSDPEFTQYVYKHINVPKNNIVVMQTTNTLKSYSRNSLMKIQYVVCNDIAHAINQRTNNTYMISAYDGAYGTLTFGTLRQQPTGAYQIDMMYKNKITAFWYKDMLVCYDGEKSLECVRPYFQEWEAGGIRQVDILQFCSNKDFFYQEDIANEYIHVNKLVLHFVNRDKLFPSRSGITYRNGGLGGQIYYQPAKGRKITSLNLALRSLNQQYFGEFVIPVDQTDRHVDALKHAALMISGKLHPGADIDINMAFADYKTALIGVSKNEEDVLAKWFSYCTKSTKSTDDGIIRAYTKMKTNLEKEYKEISSYLNCYDFSKCMPVPRIEMDKKLRENCYKSLHVESKNVIINSINNKRINPINEMRPTVKFMVLTKGNCVIGEMPINKYYDAKTNSISLNYNKMKGEVIRDKIKNRR